LIERIAFQVWGRASGAFQQTTPTIGFQQPATTERHLVLTLVCVSLPALPHNAHCSTVLVAVGPNGARNLFSRCHLQFALFDGVRFGQQLLRDPASLRWCQLYLNLLPACTSQQQHRVVAPP
jgi:hypothetical protein